MPLLDLLGPQQSNQPFALQLLLEQKFCAHYCKHSTGSGPKTKQGHEVYLRSQGTRQISKHSYVSDGISLFSDGLSARGRFPVSIVINDTYLHVPVIFQAHQRLLRLAVESHHFCFVTLPFG